MLLLGQRIRGHLLTSWVGCAWLSLMGACVAQPAAQSGGVGRDGTRVRGGQTALADIDHLAPASQPERSGAVSKSGHRTPWPDHPFQPSPERASASAGARLKAQVETRLGLSPIEASSHPVEIRLTCGYGRFVRMFREGDKASGFRARVLFGSAVEDCRSQPQPISDAVIGGATVCVQTGEELEWGSLIDAMQTAGLSTAKSVWFRGSRAGPSVELTAKLPTGVIELISFDTSHVFADVHPTFELARVLARAKLCPADW